MPIRPPLKRQQHVLSLGHVYPGREKQQSEKSGPSLATALSPLMLARDRGKNGSHEIGATEAVLLSSNPEELVCSIVILTLPTQAA